ncbi:ImmA/IrrE family metallo-endopeptidase [Pedococcus sp. NPDC057267]|uniref:ImmA/IrrE family metallo-endopeptidase n=1 Tax=Pedococcus sp. NPDC057267 TaxID=3346077 RepID=UPI0036397EB6
MSTRRDHARRLVDAIEPAQRAAIAKHPITGIESLGYTVVAEPALTSRRGAGGLCDGLSFAEHNTVMYSPTPGSRKENFTLLHEVGHILVERDDDALNWLADRDDPDSEVERLCEEVAANLVIPESLLDDVVGTGPITGEDLKALVARSAASGPACAIALSNRLSSGAVVIIDRAAGRVVHSALRGDNLTVYPWSNTNVPVNHPLLALQPGDTATRKTFWTDEWKRRQEYYVSAIATEKRLYAVFSTSDLWGVEVFHGGPLPPAKSEAPRLGLRCHCGYVGRAFGWPCATCKRQYCPRCGECDCPRRDRAQGICTKCFLQAPDLENGVCGECR